jgi:hypothetical protein
MNTQMLRTIGHYLRHPIRSLTLPFHGPAPACASWECERPPVRARFVKPDTLTLDAATLPEKYRAVSAQMQSLASIAWANVRNTEPLINLYRQGEGRNDESWGARWQIGRFVVHADSGQILGVDATRRHGVEHMSWAGSESSSHYTYERKDTAQGPVSTIHVTSEGDSAPALECHFSFDDKGNVTVLSPETWRQSDIQMQDGHPVWPLQPLLASSVAQQ